MPRKPSGQILPALDQKLVYLYGKHPEIHGHKQLCVHLVSPDAPNGISERRLQQFWGSAPDRVPEQHIQALTDIFGACIPAGYSKQEVRSLLLDPDFSRVARALNDPEPTRDWYSLVQNAAIAVLDLVPKYTVAMHMIRRAKHRAISSDEDTLLFALNEDFQLRIVPPRDGEMIVLFQQDGITRIIETAERNVVIAVSQHSIDIPSDTHLREETGPTEVLFIFLVLDSGLITERLKDWMFRHAARYAPLEEERLKELALLFDADSQAWIGVRRVWFCESGEVEKN